MVMLMFVAAIHSLLLTMGCWFGVSMLTTGSPDVMTVTV